MSYEYFLRGIEAADEAARPTLHKLGALFALWRVHEDPSFFRATDLALRFRDPVHQTVRTDSPSICLCVRRH